MASVTSDTDPVSAFATSMAAAADQLADLTDANREAGRVVIANARPPRASGAMASGQQVRVAEWGAQLVSSVSYWTFVHWGAPGAGVKARPWFVEAAQRSPDQVREVYLAHARQVFNRID